MLFKVKTYNLFKKVLIRETLIFEAKLISQTLAYRHARIPSEVVKSFNVTSTTVARFPDACREILTIFQVCDPVRMFPGASF
jgi:hypothetical protein